VFYVLYEQCSTDSSNSLNVTTLKNYKKATYVLQYTFLIFSKAPSFSSYSLLKTIVPFYTLANLYAPDLLLYLNMPCI